MCTHARARTHMQRTHSQLTWNAAGAPLGGDAGASLPAACCCLSSSTPTTQRSEGQSRAWPTPADEVAQGKGADNGV